MRCRLSTRLTHFGCSTGPGLSLWSVINAPPSSTTFRRPRGTATTNARHDSIPRRAWPPTANRLPVMRTSDARPRTSVADRGASACKRHVPELHPCSEPFASPPAIIPSAHAIHLIIRGVPVHPTPDYTPPSTPTQGPPPAPNRRTASDTTRMSRGAESQPRVGDKRSSASPCSAETPSCMPWARVA